MRAGKVRYLGLSEASAASIARACKVHLIAALDVVLSPAELAELDKAFPPDVAAGLRYPSAFLGSVNA